MWDLWQWVVSLRLVLLGAVLCVDDHVHASNNEQ